MNERAIQDFSITRAAIDPRADGARRIVHVSATLVTIERVLQGVRMRIGVPVASYRDLVITVRLPSGNGALSLRHEDQDLNVTLATGAAIDVARQAKAWGELFARPIAIEEAYVEMKRPIRRRRRGQASRRPARFPKHRGTGIGARLETRFGGEDEIIARD